MLAIFGLSILLFTAAAIEPDFSQNQNPAGELNYTLLDQLAAKLQNTSDQIRSEQRSLLINTTNTLRKKIVNRSVLIARQTPIEPCDKLRTTGNHRLQLPYQKAPITVVCDMDTLPGGWILIQQRLAGSVDFNRSWAEYRDGFGEVGPFNDFWLGLETIHQLTKNNDQQLLVVLKDETGHYGYAQFGRFRIAGEEQDYKLYCTSEYKGDIGKALCFINDNKFATFDKDNGRSFAQKYGSGWWFDEYGSTNLNGPFEKNRNTGKGIVWSDWTSAATYCRMLIRSLP